MVSKQGPYIVRIVSFIGPDNYIFMDYSLAQQLKDAGFPQYTDQILSSEDVRPQTAYCRRGHRTFDLSIGGYPKSEPDYYEQGKWRPSCIFSKQYLESDESETLYFPTLDELIEACGWNLWNLDQTDEGEWCARGRSKKPMSGLVEFYSTPTEAVARLWLALNTKK